MFFGCSSAAPVLNMPVCFACGDTGCSFLSETVTVTCSKLNSGE